MDSEYFDAAFKKLMEVAESQERHWSELPKMLDKSAANFAVKANSAATDAVTAGVSPLRDLLEQQGHDLKGLSLPIDRRRLSRSCLLGGGVFLDRLRGRDCGSSARLRRGRCAGAR